MSEHVGLLFAGKEVIRENDDTKFSLLYSLDFAVVDDLGAHMGREGKFVLEGRTNFQSLRVTFGNHLLGVDMLGGLFYGFKGSHERFLVLVRFRRVLNHLFDEETIAWRTLYDRNQERMNVLVFAVFAQDTLLQEGLELGIRLGVIANSNERVIVVVNVGDVEFETVSIVDENVRDSRLCIPLVEASFEFVDHFLLEGENLCRDRMR